MREFDAICPRPVREFTASDIKRLRKESQVPAHPLLQTDDGNADQTATGDCGSQRVGSGTARLCGAGVRATFITMAKSE